MCKFLLSVHCTVHWLVNYNNLFSSSTRMWLAQKQASSKEAIWTAFQPAQCKFHDLVCARIATLRMPASHPKFLIWKYCSVLLSCITCSISHMTLDFIIANYNYILRLHWAQIKLHIRNVGNLNVPLPLTQAVISLLCSSIYRLREGTKKHFFGVFVTRLPTWTSSVWIATSPGTMTLGILKSFPFSWTPSLRIGIENTRSPSFKVNTEPMLSQGSTLWVPGNLFALLYILRTICILYTVYAQHAYIYIKGYKVLCNSSLTLGLSVLLFENIIHKINMYRRKGNLFCTRG